MLARLCTAVLAALALFPAAARATAAPKPCPIGEGFLCGVLTVPIDRAGLVPGTLDLHYEVQAEGPAPILLDLAGGPGQADADLAFLVADPLKPLLRTHRLAVLDQRGTGDTALECPTLQSQSLPQPSTVADCAAQLGPARAFYTTVDSVLDIEDLRNLLGAPALAVSGTSYGTYVAEQYARAFPARVERLLLNSPVGLDNVGAFYQERFGALPRMLRDQCAHGACRHITPAPVADVTAVAHRLQAGHPLRGTVYDDHGRAHTLQIRNETELSEILLSADVYPELQAALPAALRAAARRDGAPLLRTLTLLAGGTSLFQDDADELSTALNVTTTCQDAALPYALDSPLGGRAAQVQAALRALPPSAYAPFTTVPVLKLSLARECERWPPTAPRARFTGPLPDVPALVLVGRQDLRTPVENTAAILAALPHASLLAVAGAGHDVLDTDPTGCVQTALRRWADGLHVADPCRGRNNGQPLTPLAPRSIGNRNDAIRATLADAKRQFDLSHAFFVDPGGGGLRGGSWRAKDHDPASLVLKDYEYVRGLRVSGRPHPYKDTFRGTLTINGTRTVTIDRQGHVR